MHSIFLIFNMKIIIAGAGDVGFHLAKLLSYESQDTYIVDLNGDRLNYINNHLDVITKKGDATSIKLLKEIGISSADLLLAVTESQNTNFTIFPTSLKVSYFPLMAQIKKWLESVNQIVGLLPIVFLILETMGDVVTR